MFWSARQALWPNPANGGKRQKNVQKRERNMRLTLALPFIALALAACTPPLPESGAQQGVGFQDYDTYLNRQSRVPTVAAPVVPPANTGFSPAGAAAAIDRADGTQAAAAAPVFDPSDPNRPRGNAPAGIQEQSGEMQPKPGGISDEQDFAAVSQRETIESDKARIERNRSQYVVVQPGALPTRPGDTGPNIVEYAIATKHAPGTQMYKRSSFRVSDPAATCAKYGSPDIAQEAFLAKGGPERDRLGLDPDGDGFACTWDPRPFRAAAN
jgi:hypothetical protein